MNQGQLDDAFRRAMNILDVWNDISGCFTKDTGYYYEIQGVIKDAVQCGIQAHAGIYEPLDGETGVPLPPRMVVHVPVPSDFNMGSDLIRIAHLVTILLMVGMSPDIILRRLTKEPDHTGVVI